jgi:hypothetical protein
MRLFYAVAEPVSDVEIPILSFSDMVNLEPSYKRQKFGVEQSLTP